MIQNYGLREVSDLTFFSLKSDGKFDKPILYMDYALTSTNDHTLETVYARGGKGNPRRIPFHGNKESMLTVTTQIFDFRLISLISGASVSVGATNVFKREELIAVDNGGSIEITLSATPETGWQFENAFFLKANDAVEGSELTGVIAGAVVSFATGVTAGDVVVAYYVAESAITSEKISFKSNGFPQTIGIVGDTLLKRESDGALIDFQMVAYKASANGTFTFTQASEGDPTSLEITFDLFEGADGSMIDYVRID